MAEIYVLVVDSAKARLLHADSKTNPLTEINVFEHPEARMHARDLSSDLPGRDSNRSGQGRHRLDSSSDPKHQTFVEFSREVSKHLEELVNQKKVDQLMLISAPAFLGLLRDVISDKVKSHITFELDKNLAGHSLDDIRAHLPYFKPVERLII